MLIVIGGMIGLGKTTMSNLIADEFHIPVYYESVDDNKVLPLYYKASEEEQQKHRYPFLLQLNFLTSRYHSIKEALKNDNAVLDRSIYEDQYFAYKIHKQNRMTDLEYELYSKILDEMLEEIDGMPRKAPAVMIYLRGSFETCLKRISERGRSFELGDELIDYYRYMWKDYDEWVMKSYHASPIIIVDVDKRDCLLNEKDRQWLFEQVNQYLKLK